MRGKVSYLAGKAAEESVARHYDKTGHAIAARRWRGLGGEIDLVVRKGGELIFVEVKQSRSFEQAAWRVTERQMRRIYTAASEFLAGEPQGELTPSRFDVALVDGHGRIDILENAYAA
ncbi:YraN family protein [Acidimangrovimonas sediminis]|uniref:YraN family protein n=1 Tax=Acidimangrovimonas sediminis TaxID=2056283 RepID=UPI000C7F9CAF|nr:YraN family protein [Acidimangrovimonas sediminis]